jgi:fatty-acyl-CoA synthase
LVIDGLDWWARAVPDKTAAILGDESLTYAELDSWAGRIAAGYGEHGVGAGDRVGILAGTSLTFCAAAVGIYKLGAVAVPMSTRLTASELSVLIESSEPTIVLTEPDLADKLPDQRLVMMDDLEALREGEAVTHPQPDVAATDPAALLYTSGTTGRPKGVIFTHDKILSSVAEWTLSEPGFNHDMRLLMVLPLGSTPGLMWGITHTFIRGGTLVLEQQFNPQTALEALEQQQITAMVGVPLLYEAIAAQPGFADADLSQWSTAHVGGARVSEKLLKSYADKGVRLRQIYGMTELGGSVTATPLADALTKPDFCGRGNLFTRLRTVRDDGSDCDPGEPGQILIKGPSVTAGYWGDPEATAETIKDGWLYSGDLGFLDEDGYLKMVDRVKDLIITGGLNVAPTEIENVIDALDAIAEVAVISADDEKFGETPAAIVRLEGEVTPEEIVAHCNEHLADFKVPRYVVIVQEPLPRMASGKVAKRQLRELHPDIAAQYEKVR